MTTDLAARRGKLGNWVYCRPVHGPQWRRRYFIPTQPGTAPQAAWWGVFAGGVIAWQNLPEAEKRYWRRIADKEKMTGFNSFMSRYLKEHR